SACDKFVYMDVLRAQTASDEPEQQKPAARSWAKELRGDARLMNLLRTGIEAASDDEGWANLGAVGSHVNKQSPDFDPRNWRYTKLVDLVSAIGLFEVERETGADGRTKSIRVREKRKRS
ncbi:OST-HTH/LOTUS domain-containing protein, partial [Nocardioides sp.]|uniref:OST-HTH/LOTUS domain-containing protein n=1 Tax=Nocardioides sp. TaxID=35761 RepID=UPI0027335ACC